MNSDDDIVKIIKIANAGTKYFSFALAMTGNHDVSAAVGTLVASGLIINEGVKAYKTARPPTKIKVSKHEAMNRLAGVVVEQHQLARVTQALRSTARKSSPDDPNLKVARAEANHLISRTAPRLEKDSQEEFTRQKIRDAAEVIKHPMSRKEHTVRNGAKATEDLRKTADLGLRLGAKAKGPKVT